MHPSNAKIIVKSGFVLKYLSTKYPIKTIKRIVITSCQPKFKYGASS
jgi:hypothetical protein